VGPLVVLQTVYLILEFVPSFRFTFVRPPLRVLQRPSYVLLQLFYFFFFTIHFLRNTVRRSSHPTFGKDRDALT
jgi:hypothetical protein